MIADIACAVIIPIPIIEFMANEHDLPLSIGIGLGTLIGFAILNPIIDASTGEWFDLKVENGEIIINLEPVKKSSKKKDKSSQTKDKSKKPKSKKK